MKLFVGPMSKNVVDATIEFIDENPSSDILGFIPSRRQIEAQSLGGGYVNNWCTESFVEYIKSRNPDILIKRDHSGPGQGNSYGQHLESLFCDIESGVKLIHIDPWKEYRDISSAAEKTAELIEYCYIKDNTCLFEVGTEEQIRKYSPDELEEFLDIVRELCPDESFLNVRYAVVQSGTKVCGLSNIGKFNPDRSIRMCEVVNKFGLFAKEHNSDYLSIDELKARNDCGVDFFNIAPEFGVLETRTLIDELQKAGLYTALRDFTFACIKSGKWEKWVPKDDSFFDVSLNIEYLAMLSGHYNFTSPEYNIAHELLYYNDVDFDKIVKDKIKARLMEISKA